MRMNYMQALMSIFNAVYEPPSAVPLNAPRRRDNRKTGSREFRPRSQQKRRIHARQRGEYK